jgi:Protein of unknown function, DUF255
MERTSNQRSVPIALIAVAALLVAARVGAHFLDGGARADRVKWVAMDDAVPIAQATGQPILFYFRAPDHRIESEVFGNADIAADINERFVPVRVEGRSPQIELLERTFNVRARPAVIFSDAFGNERGRMEGFRGPEEFRRVMEGVR